MFLLLDPTYIDFYIFVFRQNVTVKTDGMIRKSVFHSAKDNKIAKAATSRTTLLLKKKDPKQEDEGENGFHYSDFDENDVEMNICKLAHYHGILEHLLHLKTSFNNVDGELRKGSFEIRLIG